MDWGWVDEMVVTKEEEVGERGGGLGDGWEIISSS
jgi:hypothetical protein